MPQDGGDGFPSSGASASAPIKEEEPKHVESEEKKDLVITEVGVEVSEGKVTFIPAALSDETGSQQQQANINEPTEPESSSSQSVLDPPKQENAHAPEPVEKAPEAQKKEEIGNEVPPG